MPFRSSARGTYGPQGIKIIKGPLPPVWVTSGALPTCTTAPYSRQLSATDDSGDNPLYSLQSGSLPTGLTLSPAGLISGTASGASTTYSFTVRATDTNGRSSVSNAITIQTILIINGFPSQSPGGMTTTTENGFFHAYRTSQGDSTISVVPGGEIIMALVGSQGSIPGNSSSICSRDGGGGGRGGMSIVRFTVPSGVSSLLLSVGGAGASGIDSPQGGGYNGGGSSGSWYGGGGQFGSGYRSAAGGGGYTGVFNSSKTQGNTYLMVGGGGGAGQNGSDQNRGAGGGLNANGTPDSGNTAATPTTAGAFTGGTDYYNQPGSGGGSLVGGAGGNSWLDQGGGGGGGFFGGGGGQGGGGCSGGYGGGGSGKIQTVTTTSYYNYSDIASLKSGLTTYYGLSGNSIPGNVGTSSTNGGIFVWATV